MKSQNLTLFLGLLLLGLSALACGQAHDAATTDEPNLPSRPSRILPANSSVLDLALELVDRERIVAIPNAALEWSSIAEERDAWADVPLLYHFAGEEVLSLAPDLILVHDYQDEAAKRIAREAGIAVLDLPYPKTWEGVLEGVLVMGQALGEPERARALHSDLESRKSALEGTQRESLRVLPYANFGSGGWTAGGGTTLDLVIRLAGLENAATSAGLEGHVDVSLEEVLAIEPDMFLCSRGIHGSVSSAEYLRSEVVLADQEAIRLDRIVILPAAIHSSASHLVLDAAEALAQKVDALFADR